MTNDSATARREGHWADLRERGASWGPAILAFIYRVFGRSVCLIAMAPAVLYFYLTGAAQRRASLDYLRRLWRAKGWPAIPGHWRALKHFFAFGIASLDKFAAWIGDIPRSAIDEIDGPLFDRARHDPRGALLLTAHFGNPEILRAIATREQTRRVNVIIHTQHAERFNRLIERFAPHSSVRVIQATDVGVATAVLLAQAIERGEWVVIMADRISVRHGERALKADFLGAPAWLPLGPFLLVLMLKCPAYLLFCYRVGGRRRVHFSQLAEAGETQRSQRDATLQKLVDKYVAVLADVLGDAPYQWFNFFDFWAERRQAAGEARAKI